MVESGIWLQIVQLKSLREMNKLLPEYFEDVRNLFQILLTETYNELNQTKHKVLAMPDLDPEVRQNIM